MPYYNPLLLLVLQALAPSFPSRPLPPCPDRDRDHICDPVDRCVGDDYSGDADRDGLCADRDQCWGDDRRGDSDRDGWCDDRDTCVGVNTTGDVDGDGLCGSDDVCLGSNTSGDRDADGVCNDRDRCRGDDSSGDSDLDHVCDDVDLCVGDESHGDHDGDGWCDDLDVCWNGDDDLLNLDHDDRCDSFDSCQGDNGTLDWDHDGWCADRDVCRGDDASGDADSDGVCDDRDACLPGEIDGDGDGICQDLCLGHDRTGDSDADGLCDDVDPCDDATVAPGTACVAPSPLPANPCGGEPVLVLGRNTGFVTCPDGSLDRLSATGGWLLPETESPPNHTLHYGGVHACTSDAECDSRPHGACVPTPNGYESPQRCVWGCDSDLDCLSGEYCLPPGVGVTAHGQGRVYRAGSPVEGRGRCEPAICQAGADCGSGECGYAKSHGGCDLWSSTLLCRTEETDACRTTAECPSVDDHAPSCDGRRSAAGTWSFSCSYVSSAALTCGRPLLDDGGRARLPPVRHDRGGAPRAAQVWAQICAMEQASVASFARHALELMALGAPADLLAGVAQAQADELAHAALAARVAAHLGGRVTLGPTRLAGLGLRRTPAEVLDALVLEGCVGETCAAAEAVFLAERAVDPMVRAALRQIAEDEARHAALAWRTAAWVVRRWPELRGRLVAGAEAALALPAGPGEGEGMLDLGVCDAATRRAVRRDVAGAVIGAALARV